MRTNHKSSPSNRTAPTAGSEEDGIEVKLHAPNARAVFVAGNFNGWDPRRTSLHKDSGGVWRTFLPLSPGRYEYRFIVDGQWMDDPLSPAYAPNPFGGLNCVLVADLQP